MSVKPHAIATALAFTLGLARYNNFESTCAQLISFLLYFSKACILDILTPSAHRLPVLPLDLICKVVKYSVWSILVLQEGSVFYGNIWLST